MIIMFKKKRKYFFTILMEIVSGNILHSHEKVHDHSCLVYSSKSSEVLGHLLHPHLPTLPQGAAINQKFSGAGVLLPQSRHPAEGVILRHVSCIIPSCLLTGVAPNGVFPPGCLPFPASWPAVPYYSNKLLCSHLSIRFHFWEPSNENSVLQSVSPQLWSFSSAPQGEEQQPVRHNQIPNHGPGFYWIPLTSLCVHSLSLRDGF